MIKQLQENIIKNALAEQRPIDSIRAIPVLQELTKQEFNLLIKKYSPESSQEDSHPKETLREYFDKPKEVKNSYPSISFRVPKELKKRWVEYVDSQTTGRYFSPKGSPILIKMLIDFLDENEK
jgi:hypothetical protein